MSHDENDEALNLAIKASLEEEIINPSSEENDEDEQLKKALETSLIENQNQNDDLFNSVIYESLDNDILIIDETILAKVIEDSNLSNISVRLNTEIINSGMSSNIASIINMSNTSDTIDSIDTESEFINSAYNEYKDDVNDLNVHDDEDEEEYMKMIIQQIKESEELENKLKINKITKSIIEAQDFEYEEALRKDIEKDIEKDIQKNIEKEKITSATINKLENTDTINSDTIISKIIDEPVLPKTKEELRKLRMAFYDKK